MNVVTLVAIFCTQPSLSTTKHRCKALIHMPKFVAGSTSRNSKSYCASSFASSYNTDVPRSRLGGGTASQAVCSLALDCALLCRATVTLHDMSRCDENKKCRSMTVPAAPPSPRLYPNCQNVFPQQTALPMVQVVEALRPHGLTLQNFASIREQTMGGFTQVGSHGSGATIPPVDEQVVSIKLVTPAKGCLELSKVAALTARKTILSHDAEFKGGSC